MLGKTKAKYIQSLAQKKVRDEDGVFITEGPKMVAELLASAGPAVLQLYALREWIAINHEVAKNIDVIEVDERDLAKISQLITPNKVLAIVKKPILPEQIRVQGNVSLVLDTIQDPGNMGTIIRIAD